MHENLYQRHQANTAVQVQFLVSVCLISRSSNELLHIISDIAHGYTSPINEKLPNTVSKTIEPKTP